MKLIIAGSRDLDQNIVYAELIKLRSVGHIMVQASEIVCGMARGSDMAGKQYGDFYGIPVIPFEPDYDKYGRYRAPKIRNNKMAVYGDALLLIWDGKSGGSRHMKEAMSLLNKPVYEIIIG